MSLPALHVLATDAVVAAPGFTERATGMQEACGECLAVHLRLRETSDRRLFSLAETLEEGAVETDGWLVVNRRVDVALAVGADAVQLGRGALPIAAVRDVAGGSVHIGASVHDLATADLRRREGADYLLAGSVYQTTTHPGIAAAGVEFVERLVPMRLPVIAIGGITIDRVGAVLDAGAAGIAVLGAVWDAADPVAAAARLCKLLER